MSSRRAGRPNARAAPIPSSQALVCSPKYAKGLPEADGATTPRASRPRPRRGQARCDARPPTRLAAPARSGRRGGAAKGARRRRTAPRRSGTSSAAPGSWRCRPCTAWTPRRSASSHPTAQHRRGPQRCLCGRSVARTGTRPQRSRPAPGSRAAEAAGCAGVELAERDGPRARDLVDEQTRDEEAGEHEEHVDADESPAGRHRRRRGTPRRGALRRPAGPRCRRGTADGAAASSGARQHPGSSGWR